MVEQLIPRRKFRIKSKEFGDQWQVVSYQKQASDVELTGGETVQQRIDRLIALVTELTTTITNTKSAEAQTHSELENEMNLLEADLKNGIREIEHELLNLDVEGDGAEDFTRLKTATENLKTATETKLDQLKLDVDELLNYELDPSMTNIYDYLSDRIDRLRQHIELLFSGLAAIIGDGDITDVLYNAGIEITDTTDTSLVAALKQHHSKLIAQAAYYNDIGNMAPPYAWQKFEYDHNTPAADSLVTVEVSNTSLTVNWHFVFYYLPVFKLLKVTGYVNLLQNGGTDPVGVNVHILNKKLRLMYADSYQTMTNTYSSLPHSDNLFIDHRQGVLMTDPADTKTFGFGYYDGAFGIKQVDFFGISMGDDEDVAYRPAGFNVWSAGPQSSVEIVPWSSGEWEKKEAMLRAHYQGDINIYDHWQIGDICEINLPAMSGHNSSEIAFKAQTVSIVLVDKNVNLFTPAAFTWDMQDTLAASGSGLTMNTTSTNAGGWRDSAMRTWCNETFYSSLPSGFKTLIQPTKVITRRGNTEADETEDYCFLRSELEIFGTSVYGSPSDGFGQLEYYKTAANRRKYTAQRKSSGNYLSYYWLRSPVRSSSVNFCAVSNDSNSQVISRDARYAFQVSVGGSI